VFPASFDLSAAEAVSGGIGLDAVECLVRLVDRSLVHYEPDQGRYRLLETLRQYGADRLAEVGETELTRDRLARHFLDLAEQLAPELATTGYARAHSVLTVELDNLRAVAEWCMEGERWAELAAMMLRLWTFLFQTGPAVTLPWFERVVEHAEDLDPQALVDTLGHWAWTAAGHMGDFQQGAALAECSIGLAERCGLDQNPWAWIARSQAALMSIPRQEGLGYSQVVLAAAEARDEGTAAVIAIGQTGMWQQEMGEFDRAAISFAAALRRAEHTQHPVSIQSAVVTAAAAYLFSSTERDLAASSAILTRHAGEPRIDDATAMWTDVFLGATLVGLRRTGAVEPLARAVRLADRRNVRNAEEMALNLLAVAAAVAGHREEAAILANYASANLHTGTLDTPQYKWIPDALNEALTGITDSAAPSIPGTAPTRAKMMAVVAHLDATSDLAAPTATQH
jgi:hypothetical protein